MAAVLALAVVPAFAACTLADPSAPPAFAIATQPSPGPLACALGLRGGELVRDPVTGLGFPGLHVRWPFGWTASEVDGVVRLYDAFGDEVAHEGQMLSIGGGFSGDAWRMCGGVRAVWDATPLPSIVSIALPTLGAWPLPTYPIVATCGGVGTPVLTLNGNPTDGVYAVVVSGAKVPIEWPPGYTADFAPSLEIRGPSGIVVATAGMDLLTTAPPGLSPCFGGDGVSMVPFGD